MTDSHQICFTNGEDGHRLAGPSFSLVKAGEVGEASLRLSHMMSALEITEMSGAVHDAIAVAKGDENQKATVPLRKPLPAASSPLPKQTPTVISAGSKVRGASEKGGR